MVWDFQWETQVTVATQQTPHTSDELPDYGAVIHCNA